MFIETQYFSQTIESGASLSYDPYRGRGFLHLTHDYNYRKYKKDTGEDITDDIEDNLEKIKLVSTNLWYAADTAGWFWKFGSVKGNVNLIADIGTVEQVTRAVQGGKRALKERTDAYNLLLTIFKDEDC
jgi:predicted chitinase